MLTPRLACLNEDKAFTAVEIARRLELDEGSVSTALTSQGARARRAQGDILGDNER